MFLTTISCSACGTVVMAAQSAGYQSCPSCGMPVDLGGNSQAGDLRRIAGTPGREPDKQNANLYETIPRVQVPQPVSQHHDADVELVFVDPFVAGVPYSNEAYGEIGSNNPVNTAYSRRVIYRALWQSPVFDLRTELGTSQGNANIALPINRGPAYGQGARLNLQLTRGQAGTSYEALYNYQFVDNTALSDSAYMVQTCAPQSVTAAVRNAPIAIDNTGLATTLLSFSAPANPVRFWQVVIVVDIMANDLLPAASPAFHRVKWWAG